MKNTQHTTYNPDVDAVAVRDAVAGGEGFFTVTLPVSSDQRARDGDAFDVDRLRGFEQQINSDRTVPVFLSHGRGPLTEERYGALGKIGRVTNADLETRDGATVLMSDLEIADPDDLAEEGDTGDVEAALRWVRSQFQLGLGAVSVGWKEDIAGRDVPGDAELLEVSIVGIESDTEAQQAGAEPTKAAVRGFEALPSKTEGTRPDNWGLRAHDPDPPTDTESVADALDTLQHVREFHRQGDDVPPWQRREKTPPTLATIDQILEHFGHGKRGVDLSERIEELAGDTPRGNRQREDILARLETVEDHTPKLASPSTHFEHGAGAVRQYPFGRSGKATRERINDAVEAIEDALTDEETVEGWGMAAMTPAADTSTRDAASTVKEAFDAIGGRGTSDAHRTLYDAFEPGASADQIRQNLEDIRSNPDLLNDVLDAIGALRERDNLDADAAGALKRLRTVLVGGAGGNN